MSDEQDVPPAVDAIIADVMQRYDIQPGGDSRALANVLAAQSARNLPTPGHVLTFGTIEQREAESRRESGQERLLREQDNHFAFIGISHDMIDSLNYYICEGGSLGETRAAFIRLAPLLGYTVKAIP